MKKGFRNYNFDFDKNETKILTAMCRQVLKQTAGDQKYFQVERAFSSVLQKLEGGEDVIKLTKDEYLRLADHLTENLRHLKQKSANAWFFTRWLYRSMITQYQTLLDNHFKD
jgi:hypothetical protein